METLHADQAKTALVLGVMVSRGELPPEKAYAWLEDGEVGESDEVVHEDS